MKTELESRAIRLGMESEAEEWLRVLQQRKVECVATLDREHMRYECIFKSQFDGRMYLSWFSVQGEDGLPVAGSPFDIDRLHLEYWDRCVDPDVPPIVFAHVITFTPAEVESVISGDSSVAPPAP